MTHDAAPAVGDVTATGGAGESAAATAGVSIIGVTKSFPGVRALSNADFDCRPGEVHALVGENGSGKSTMIKIASGCLRASTRVTVLIGGEELGGGGVQRARRLGLITAYQDTSLVTDLTVADNIALSFNAIGHGEACRPGRLSLPASTCLSSSPTSSPHSVPALGSSSKWPARWRTSPQVLMLDEPTAALDLRLAAKLEEIIKRARDEGTAIVYVSHRLSEMQAPRRPAHRPARR